MTCQLDSNVEEILRKQEMKAELLSVIRSRKNKVLMAEQFSSSTLLDCVGTISFSKSQLDTIILELLEEGVVVKIRRDLFAVNYDHATLEVVDNYELYPDILASEDFSFSFDKKENPSLELKTTDKENHVIELKTKKRGGEEIGEKDAGKTKRRRGPLATLPLNAHPL